uniref:MATH domain-containing protein n=1 Tax=Brassica oleracea TaxID=3712 RepID=A0A3P6GWA6_BRAOL|nr:unnamed protein product [Brassica oleracea]
MAKQVGHKFAWVIKDFSSLREKCYSTPVQIGDCKWRLVVYLKGLFKSDHISLFLEVADVKSLPFGWKRLVKFRLTIAKQVSEVPSLLLSLFEQGPSVLKKSHRWFDQKNPLWGFPTMIPLAKIHDKNEGFLVNDQLMIVAEVDVLQVVVTSEKSEETNPLSQLKIVVEIELLEIIGKVEVNGFHLLSSQVESVSRMFEKHPETASEVHLKNPNLRTGYMSLLLSLIDTLCQSPHKLPKDDLDEAHYALESLTDAGFKLDWLEKKISQVSEMKEKEKDGESRRQDIEKELKDLKQKCSDVEAQLKKEKSEALAAKAPFSFDDIIQ